jgi:hypothetical protein
MMRAIVDNGERGHLRRRLLLGALARHRIQTRWAPVQVGMSEHEVRLLCGAPATDYPAQMAQSDSLVGSLIGTYMFDSFQEKWAYGRWRDGHHRAEGSEVTFSSPA